MDGDLAVSLPTESSQQFTPQVVLQAVTILDMIVSETKIDD